MLGHVVNLKLFSGAEENTMEVVALPEVEFGEQLILNPNKYTRDDFLERPKLDGYTDLAGNVYYDAQSLLVSRNYGIGTKDKFHDFQLPTDGYSTLDVTLSILDNGSAKNDISVFFVADDYQFVRPEDTDSHSAAPDFSGTTLKEVTLPISGEPKQVSIKLDGTKSVSAFLKTKNTSGNIRVILSDGVLKK